MEKIERKTREDIRNTSVNIQDWGKKFTSKAVIGGKIFSNNPKTTNHVHKNSKYLVSVIITLGRNISGEDTMFYDVVETSDLGSRAHVLKYLHGRMIFGPFENFP